LSLPAAAIAVGWWKCLLKPSTGLLCCQRRHDQRLRRPAGFCAQ